MERVVLDIEGTVCPISFVHDVLFPFAVKRAREEIPRIVFPLDAARSLLESYLAAFPPEYTKDADTLLGHIEDLVARDVKAGYLKALQGYLWQAGYEAGEIQAPVFADAVAAMRRWAAATEVYIYSSGSVAAQKLLFAHTRDGDLRPLIAGYYDTQNAGPKTETASYERIAADVGAPGSELRFYSDNPKEIDAAHAAGWRTTFTVRPGNPQYDYKGPDVEASDFTNL